MHAILPALVALLLLAYGGYVLYSRGVSRISLIFVLICLITTCWQLSWALLFLLKNQREALVLVKFGYLPILFLPSALYHFIASLTGRDSERRGIVLSYAVSALLGLILLSSDALTAGVHHYYYGYYPRAGWLHPLHLLQTASVMVRSLYLLQQRHRLAVSTERVRLQFCLIGMLIYCCAGVDYLCNYGLEFYPPGVLFVATSLGLIAQAMVRHRLLADPLEVAATIAHEMRTPLATIRSQARVLARSLPELLSGYQSAVAQQLHQPALRPDQLAYLQQLATHIEAEVTRSNFIVDMMLTSATAGSLQRRDFALHSVKTCVDEALACYPFESAMRDKIKVKVQDDFTFYGSDVLLVYVLYNLFKNALYAIKSAGRGEVEIAFYTCGKDKQLHITDTGPGIPGDVLPHVFDPYYTTRHSGGGSGMGLAFCRRVLTAFGGDIRCESQAGRYTTFSLAFPA